ncbi:MAG: tetratricopeptide repeat protein [bacterium]|nr:tetratricopeptide repeat protein [bacterium]
MMSPYSSNVFIIISVIAVFAASPAARCEELPDDIRFFDSNEEFDTIDEDLDETRNTLTGLYLDVADYFYGVGKYGDAITTYASALDKDPECAAAWYGLARCYAQTGEFVKAITALEKAIFLKSDYKAKARIDDAFEDVKTLPRFETVVEEG